MQDDWDPCIQTIFAGSSHEFVPSVACSPDGQLFAAACNKGAKVYDATSGECVYTLKFMPDMPDMAVYCVAFSPCGRKLAAATKSQVRILQVDTFDCIQTLTDGEICSVHFSPDGEQLATVASNGVHVWNWKTRVKVNDLSSRLVSPSATFLSKDKLVIGSRNRIAEVWDLATHSSEQTLGDHDSGIFSIASSPDGKRLATVSADGMAKVWHQAADTKKWICSRILHNRTDVLVVCFSADGRILITGSSDSCIRLWNEANACIKIINTQGDGIGPLAVFPTGQQLLGCSEVQRKIMLWDISTSSAESPQEARLPSPEEVSIGLADNYTDRIVNLIFSPDGKTLVSHTDDGRTKIWSVGTGSCVPASDSHPAFFEKPAIASAWLAFPNGVERAAIRDIDGETVVWDLIENKRLGLPQKTSTMVYSSTKRFGSYVVICSLDAEFYAVSCFLGPVEVFYVPTGECIYTSSTWGNTPLAFSSDSRELFTYLGPTIYREKLDNGVFRTLGLGQAGTSTANFCMNTQFGKLEVSGPADEDVKLVGWGLSFRRDWILRGTERMIFIPTEHRRLIMDAIRKRFAIVCPSGRIVTMEVA